MSNDGCKLNAAFIMIIVIVLISRFVDFVDIDGSELLNSWKNDVSDW
jgi:hypothetical protein